MDLEIVRGRIDSILSLDLNNKEKRKRLNDLEKLYPQNIFIKTHLCNKCDSMKIEVWIKDKEVEL